jgi:Sulfotransferase family
MRSSYVRMMKKHTGSLIGEEEWFESCASFGPGDVFEALLRHDLEVSSDSRLIWGDKSPTHTEHIPLLASLFPSSRFIHIVRDVRDYCLSLQNAWQKNMIRGAQRWADGVMKARRDAAELAPGRYLEVRYEDLLTNPEKELRRCCEFIDVDFDPSLLELRLSSERRGAARRASGIVSTNVRKFERLLDESTRRRIEAIAGDAMRAYGYDVDYQGPSHRLSRPVMGYYRAMDALSFFRSVGRNPAGFVRTAHHQIAKRARP